MHIFKEGKPLTIQSLSLRESAAAGCRSPPSQAAEAFQRASSEEINPRPSLAPDETALRALCWKELCTG